MKARWIALSAFLAMPALAFDTTTPPLGFAFAHYTGSGIYVVEDRSVQVYEIPVAFSLRKVEEHAFGVRLTFPVSLGFFDFKPVDVLDQGFPEHLGTASLVPGVRFDLRACERWLLTPFVEAGAAQDFEGGDLVYVGGVGADSEVLFLDREVQGLLRSRLVGAQSRVHDAPERESYVEFRNALELSGPLGFAPRGHGTDLTGFVAAYVFYKPPEATVARLSSELDEGHTESTWLQWEVGITFGTRPQAKWWKIPMPRIGVSYRFGDGANAVRIVFGAPF